jgi:putative transposase
MTDTTYRKTVRHVDVPGQIHELTFSCQGRRALLMSSVLCQMLVLAIDRAVERLGFQLLAFVFMPEHVHLIVRAVRPDARISRLLYAIKKPVAERYRRRLMVEDPALCRGLIRTDNRGRGDFNLWLQGPGYDRNVIEPRTARRMIEYTHGNPVRRGLCTHPAEWPWSSWGFYHPVEMAPEVDLPRLWKWEGV